MPASKCERTAAEIRPPDLDPALAAFYFESCLHLATLVATDACVAVASQSDAASHRHGDGLFVVGLFGKTDQVGEHLTRVSEIGQRGGEEELGGSDPVVVPPLDAEALSSPHPVEPGGFEVGIEEWSSRPSDLDQASPLIEQG